MNKTQLQFASRKPSANRGSLGRRLSALAMSLLLVCSLPLAAFAEEYDLANGSITVTANDSGQYVTQEANNIKDEKQTTDTVIKQSGSETSSTTNTVTITAAENTTANVTLSGVNIDTGTSGGAAVEIKGNGDVVIELDGTNTVQSGNKHAGVEKNTTDDSGNGNLTITDENGTDGILNATGGGNGAGIGGGSEGNGSNITITGSTEVTATGGVGGSGIGGGWNGSGSNITIEGSAEVTAKGGQNGSGIGGGGSSGSGSNIIISGSAKVIANGGQKGSGIGGGNQGDGSNITISGSAQVGATGGRNGAGIGGGSSGSGSNIIINGSAEVTAKGGDSGSGIGGGSNGNGNSTGSDITVSGDAQVKAQGGNQYTELSQNYRGAGAAIGNGGEHTHGTAPNPGDDVTPNTDELTPNGKIEYYAPGADMEKDASIKTVTGTYVPPQPENPVQPAALYRVIGQDGMAVGGKTEQKDGVLTITVDADFASLTGYLGGLQGLRAQGVDTIVFVTKGATSTFALADLMASMTAGDSYALTHDGETVNFTLATGTDISDILK